MQAHEIKTLKHLIEFTISEGNRVYRYDSGVYTFRNTMYYPMCFMLNNTTYRYQLYDYVNMSKSFLKSSCLTKKFVETAYTTYSSYKPIRWNIEDITLNQAQHIIDYNIHLFNQINEKTSQDELIAALCQ